MSKTFSISEAISAILLSFNFNHNRYLSFQFFLKAASLAADLSVFLAETENIRRNDYERNRRSRR